ncbi:MAG: hypothetical protein WC956_10390 [bacterium]
MGHQLKQALLNAGLISKDKLKEIEKEKVKARHVKESKKMREDQLRIVCDACGKSAPDVERYIHKNRLIEGKEWLCLRCADDSQIDDECRVTNQSSQAQVKLFRRQYGRTKKFE